MVCVLCVYVYMCDDSKRKYDDSKKEVWHLGYQLNNLHE